MYLQSTILSHYIFFLTPELSVDAYIYDGAGGSATGTVRWIGETRTQGVDIYFLCAFVQEKGGNGTLHLLFLPTRNIWPFTIRLHSILRTRVGIRPLLYYSNNHSSRVTKVFRDSRCYGRALTSRPPKPDLPRPPGRSGSDNCLTPVANSPRRRIIGSPPESTLCTPTDVDLTKLPTEEIVVDSWVYFKSFYELSNRTPYVPSIPFGQTFLVA